MKKLFGIGNTRRRVQQFPKQTRCKAGDELYLVQIGAQPTDWRPMPTIGPGAIEIRIHQPHEHRIIYVATYPEGIYVIHAFEKKTRQTPQRELDIARANYGDIQQQRQKENK
ncbi:MAG TPA: type II toxin-antitoxin system RelE/ParE family toxin [Candidatus Obscuribacterales bacterium]